MNYQELGQLVRTLLPDFAVVAAISFVYALSEMVVLTYIQDSLYRWLAFFLVTALFSNLLARRLSAIARHS